MFRIAWRSLLTQQTGHGDYMFETEDDIKTYVIDLNIRFSGLIYHWVESDKAI